MPRYLTQQQIEEIKQLHRSGCKITEIAKRTGRHIVTVKDAIEGRAGLKARTACHLTCLADSEAGCLENSERGVCREIALYLLRHGPQFMPTLRWELYYPFETLKACMAHRPEWFQWDAGKVSVTDVFREWERESSR